MIVTYGRPVSRDVSAAARSFYNDFLNEQGPMTGPCAMQAEDAASVYSASLLATLVTLLLAAFLFTGSVTSSMMTTSAASPLRGPSFMMRV